MNTHKKFWTKVVFLFSLLFAAKAMALSKVSLSQPRIDDKATIFSDAAKKEAVSVLQLIYNRDHKLLLIETWPDAKKDLQELRAAAEREFLILHADNFPLSVLVIISPKNHEILAVVGKDTMWEVKRVGYDLDQAVKKTFKDYLAAHRSDSVSKRYDGALLEMVNGLERRLNKANDASREFQRANNATVNAPAIAPLKPLVSDSRQNTSVTTPKSSIAWWHVLLVILGLWLLIAVIRMLFRRRPEAGGAPAGVSGPGMTNPGGYGSGYGGGYGGGGIGQSLVGGLFGAVAGNWIYDRFFHSDSSSGFGSNAYGHESSHNSADNSSRDDEIGQSSGDASNEDWSSGSDWSDSDWGSSGSGSSDDGW